MDGGPTAGFSGGLIGAAERQFGITIRRWGSNFWLPTLRAQAAEGPRERASRRRLYELIWRVIVGYKPSDFFIGIIDFFSVILPGALLTFILLPYKQQLFNGHVLPVIEPGTSSWMAFFIVSYILGYMVSVFGGFLDELADPTSETISKFGRNRIKRRKGETLREWPGQIFRRMRSEDAPVVIDSVRECAEKLVIRRLTEDADLRELVFNDEDIEEKIKSGAVSIPTSTLIYASVRLSSSEASAQIDRLRATSKFFRSLTIVLTFLIVQLFTKLVTADKDSMSKLGVTHESYLYPLLFFLLLLLPFSLLLFAYLRHKRKESTYAYFIAINKLSKEID